MPDFVENAYAKINLTLDITGKRPDGYHTLCSVFQSVTLCDRVFLTKEPDEKIHVFSNRMELPCGKENTVQRAAEAFFTATGIKNRGVSFWLEKQIPWQAGLGGGSADAAAALRLLNRCFQAGLSEAELVPIGLEVGADVPFCLHGGTALAEGIGEKLKQLPPLPACYILLCKPAIGVGTKEAYAAFDRNRKPLNSFTEPMLEALETGNFLQVAQCVGNAFEQTACLPEVLKIKQRMLESGAFGSCMTGSGSAVFGLFKQKKQAKFCAEEFSQTYTDTFLCEPYNPETEKGTLN